MVRILYLLGGLVLLIMAVAAAVTPVLHRRSYQRAVRTTALVVDLEIEDDDAGRAHRPLLRFAAGQDNHEVTTRVSVQLYSIERMAAGDTVRIRYDPRAPTTVWIEGHENQVSVLGVLLLLLLAAGAFHGALR